MAWFTKPKTKKEQIEEQRRRRRGDTVALSVRWFNFRILVNAFLFLAMATAVWIICFAGLSPVTQQLLSSQRERVRVVASFPLSYPAAWSKTQRSRTALGIGVGWPLLQTTRSCVRRPDEGGHRGCWRPR